MHIIISLLLAVFMSSAFAANATNPPGYAVASAHPLATNAGLEILASGGNAFDAAIAVSAVLAVVEPYHSGLGGGGFWLIHDEKNQKNHFLDARERAPAAATATMFLDKNNHLIPDLSLNGGLAAAIPGEPAALVYLSEHYGRLPLKNTLAPAIKLAEQGFAADSQFIYFSSMKDRLAILRKYPASAEAFLNSNRPYALGEIIKQPELANTLKLIAQKGKAGFYEGVTAQKLVQAIQQAGGVWSLKDLKQYRVIKREPLTGNYHGLKVITAPPPSAGGLIVLNSLAILEGFNLNKLSRIEWLHYIIETMRLSYWQSSSNIADPGYVTNPLDTLRSPKTIDNLQKQIKSNTVGCNEEMASIPSKKRSPFTTHLSILDQEGNRVSATLTINYIFGSGVVAKGTGVVLNDQMDDFSTQVGEKNIFGVVGSQANQIAPGKRPLSFMTPTFLESSDRIAVLGTPGGSRIASMVLLSTLLFNDYQGAISMVSAMRFHHQYLPNVLQFEPNTFSPQLQKKLKRLGYQLMELNQYYGDMQAITWDKKTNLITAASDPRHLGLAVNQSIQQKKEGYGFKH